MDPPLRLSLAALDFIFPRWGRCDAGRLMEPGGGGGKRGRVCPECPHVPAPPVGLDVTAEDRGRRSLSAAGGSRRLGAVPAGRRARGLGSRYT